MAIISWDNQVDEKFAPVVKTVITVGRTEGSESREKRSLEMETDSREVDLTLTQTAFRLTELGWGSTVALQVVLGDQAGSPTEEMVVFTEKVRGLYLTPPTNVQVSLHSISISISIHTSIAGWAGRDYVMTKCRLLYILICRKCL